MTAMRELVLSMHITLDGFVASPDGTAAWTSRSPDGFTHVCALAESVDTLLMGRKMAPGFVAHWEKTAAAEPGNAFARRMVETPKIVFSRTVRHLDGRNLRVENGDLASVVGQLKQSPGKRLGAYGGAAFAASLLELGLVDELHLFVNPVAIGGGLRIFHGRQNFTLADSRTFSSGIVANTYRPRQA